MATQNNSSTIIKNLEEVYIDSLLDAKLAPIGRKKKIPKDAPQAWKHPKKNHKELLPSLYFSLFFS